MERKAWPFLILALLAFAGLGLELLLLLFIEPLVYGVAPADFGAAEHIYHWVFTCIVWGIVAAVLIILARKQLDFDVFSYKERPSRWGWLLCLAVLAVSIAVSVLDWNGIKVLKEFAYNGWLKFIFQYLYYLFEVALMVLIIAFAQRAGENWTGLKRIPWGGLFLGLTWGLVHMLTKGSISAGLLSLLGAALYGVIYIAVRKNLAFAYPLIFLAFVL